jgi:hypothetical protein
LGANPARLRHEMAGTGALKSKQKLGDLRWGGMAVAGLRYHLSPPAHFDFYGGARRRGQDDDGGDQLAQRSDRLAIVAQAFG